MLQAKFFLEKIPTILKTLEMYFKNSAEKFENRDTLDFTYYHLIFILYQHLIIYVRNDFTPGV